MDKVFTPKPKSRKQQAKIVLIRAERINTTLGAPVSWDVGYLKGGGPRVPFTPESGVRFPVSAVWKKQNCFFPIHVWKLLLWGASVTER